MLRRLADLATDRPKRVLAGTLVFFLVAVAFGGPVAGLLSDDDEFDDPASESQVAAQQLDDAAGVDQAPGVVVLVRDATPQRVDAIAAEVKREPRVARTEVGPPSRDGDSRYVAVTLKAGDDGDDVAERIDGTARRPRGGDSSAARRLAGPMIGEQVQEDLARAELLAFPFLFLLSLWVFRGFVAALLPLFVGVLSIFGTFLALRLTNEITPLSVFALNLAIAMGLGLAIDYSLFVVSRYREELERSGPAGKRCAARSRPRAGRSCSARSPSPWRCSRSPSSPSASCTRWGSAGRSRR